MIFATWILLSIFQLILGNTLLQIEDRKDLKKALLSHSNILVAFHENAARADSVILKMLEEVAMQSSKLARVLSVDCENNKKLCRQYKADPRPLVMQHYHKSKFNKVYDRKLRVETVLRFLEDPIGDMPWEEDESAKDIVHVKSAQELQSIVEKFKSNIPPIMIMFYAPWCGYCKKMKPEFSAAASALKGKSIFVGVNGDVHSTDDLKQVFNVTGYPSVFLIQEGNKVYKYDNENSKDALVKFVHHPSEPAPQKSVSWPEETNEIDFLTDSNFEQYIREHESVVVMFYAPWCGHCKTMKPQVVETAAQLRKLKIDGVIAALDATENKNVSDFYEIKGFPTLKYFKAGQFLFDVNERSAEGLISFFRDPKPPVEPAVEVPWRDEKSAVLHPNPDKFKFTLKRFKHALVMFYAPWCGHCKQTKPAFTAAANRMQDNAKVAFIAVDCTDNGYSSICSTHGVTGFPTLLYFNYGKNTSYSNYKLEREENTFVDFMTNPSNPRLDPRQYWRKIPRNEVVTMLETENFTDKIFRRKGSALVMFYSPWCPACVAMKPEFVNAAVSLEKNLPSFLFGAVDVTAEAVLTTQHHITSLPTLIYFPPDQIFQVYAGGAREADIVDYIMKKDKEWKMAEADKIKKEKRIKETNEKEKIRTEEDRIRKEKEKQETEQKRMREEKEKQEAEARRIRGEKEKQEAEAEARRIREEQESEERRIKEEKEKQEAQARRIREETEKQEAEARKIKEKEAEERRIKEEKEKQEAEARRIKEEKEKQEAEARRIKEEKEKQEAEARRIREETEKQEAEARRIKEEKEKQETEERRIKEEKEKQEAEARRIKEEKEKQEAEARRIKEEKEKQEAEARKIREEKAKQDAEARRIREETEAEERKIKEEEEKQEAETRRIMEEQEVEWRRIREEQEKQEAEEIIISEEKERKDKDDKIREEEETKSERDWKSVPEEKRDKIECAVLDNEDAVHAYSSGDFASVFYMHRGNQKGVVRTKLLQVLTKLVTTPDAPSCFEVDCGVLPGICDRLELVELPAVLVYRQGELLGSLVGRWDEASLLRLLAPVTSREEL